MFLIPKTFTEAPLGDKAYYALVTILALFVAITMLFYPGLSLLARIGAAIGLLIASQLMAVKILRTTTQWREEEERYADGA